MHNEKVQKNEMGALAGVLPQLVMGLWARRFPLWVPVSSLTKQAGWVRWYLPGLDDLGFPGAPAPHRLAGLCQCLLYLGHGGRGPGPALSWQEWKEELKNLTTLLHRSEELGGDEEDAWDRGDAVEEAVWKLQMFYGNGAEGKSYEELLRAKPRGKIPTSRVISLKAEEVASNVSLMSLKGNNWIHLGGLCKAQGSLSLSPFSFLFSDLFLAVLGLRCCAGFSPVEAGGGHSLVVVLRLPTVAASPVAGHGL